MHFSLFTTSLFGFVSIILTTIPSNAQKPMYTFATYAYADNNRLNNLEPLAEYLSEQTGVSVQAVSYPSVQALLSAIAHDSVDFAMMNTLGYLQFQRNHPGKAIPLVNLAMENDSITQYGTCFIVKESERLDKLAELIASSQRYTLALVKNSSTSGNLVPRLLLQAHGVPSAEEKFDTYFAGTHQQVVKDVISGKAQIGGCGCDEVSRLPKESGIRVITSYNNIPLGPVIHTRGLDLGMVQAMEKALLSVHGKDSVVFTQFRAGWTEFLPALRFQPVTDNAYDEFRQMFGTNESLWRLLEE